MANQPNELIRSHSPYLLQHSHNPVNWFEWSTELFDRATKQNKPIFLSIGYSACHWCHVMAHESFENNEIAAYLNDHFICIKVDREERPDIDHIYMDVCRVMTGSGGWPLSVFLTPNQLPIYAGTYFHPTNFLSILTKINDLWNHSPQGITENASNIMAAIETPLLQQQTLEYSMIEETYHHLASRWDPLFGGFSTAPKFPSPSNLFFLLNYYDAYHQQEALTMVEFTLNKMQQGGIYDHLGGGFSRYSTDRQWLVPHFEKMLYDNALLMMVYSNIYSLTRNPTYQVIIEEIAIYLEKNMMNLEGGFYTSEDADSEGKEGFFYTFTQEEINEVLKENAALFSKVYHVTLEGNFDGRTILNTIQTSIDTKDFDTLAKCRQQLLEYRSIRIRPSRDNKILTSLNGLAIAAFAMAGRYLNKPHFIDIAKHTLSFILTHLYKEGKLYARYHEGDVRFLAYGSDYAFLIWGLIELHQVTQDSMYLDKAKELQDHMIEHLYDHNQGGFFFSEEPLITKSKEWEDGAVPSTNGVAIYNLFRLSIILDIPLYHDLAKQSLEMMIESIRHYPSAYIFSIMNLLNFKNSPPHLVLSSHKKDDLNPILSALSKLTHIRYTLRVSLDDSHYPLVDDKPTVYLCQGNICLPPLVDFNQLKTLLDK